MFRFLALPLAVVLASGPTTAQEAPPTSKGASVVRPGPPGPAGKESPRLEPTGMAGGLTFGAVQAKLNGKEAAAWSHSAAGLSMAAEEQGPQVAAMSHGPGAAVACVRPQEEAELVVAVRGIAGPFSVSAEVDLLEGEQAEARLSLGQAGPGERVARGKTARLAVTGEANGSEVAVTMISRAQGGEALVRWRDLRLTTPDGTSAPVPLSRPVTLRMPCPPPTHAALRPGMETLLIEWDWRMQDGIGTPRASASYQAAVTQTIGRGDPLIADLRDGGVSLTEEARLWETLRVEGRKLGTDPGASDAAWEDLWRRVHRLRRRIVLANPLTRTGPLVFAKHVPGGIFSHQLTQYQGDNARPGGGIFLLPEPGRSMAVRPLAFDQLGQGAYMHPRVSYDGRQVIFAYCKIDSDPPSRGRYMDRHFHLHRIDADGGNLTQLTDGPHCDHSPCWLPNGQIVFCSTRRGGFHRCGRGPCPVYTLARCGPDGSDVRIISFHETHEWDPAVLNDGRVIYTRWDYVDRAPVHFQHLWSIRPDGSDVRIYYGNNTLNPTGIWEAQAIPGSRRVMATAAAHHAMTAGSIVLLDTALGIDDLAPLTRFTPDALFPEAEFGLDGGASWGRRISSEQLQTVRWPGHCYRSPWPLSEKYCLASYSFDPLIGEAGANRPNMFGLYLVDLFGNKELIYRDLNISSVWAAPLRSRPRPPEIPPVCLATEENTGTFFLQNVYESWTPLPQERITALRIVQVLPKTTPHGDSPKVGAAQGSPGKQVLGTVPVEEDGSAHFRAPARIPLQFQALDSQGRAVQMMYSLTYLQPGETAGCVGCHEHNARSPSAEPRPPAKALRRPPSAIRPGPDGSRPLSYPLLVQPVLDRLCVRCHNADEPKDTSGGVVLTGDRENDKSAFSRSYDALVRLVPFASNRSSPRTYPDQFGARASKLMKLLQSGHHEVRLSQDDLDRLVTWMDANALFYGTFNPEGQRRQFDGERIEGPDLE